MLSPPDFANEIEEDQAREDLDDVREQLRRCALPTREWFLPQSPDTFVFVLGATVCARCYLRIRKARWMNLSACDGKTQRQREARKKHSVIASAMVHLEFADHYFCTAVGPPSLSFTVCNGMQTSVPLPAADIWKLAIHTVLIVRDLDLEWY